MILRDYQIKLVDDGWRLYDSGHRSVMFVLPTGGGKTPCIGEILRRKGYHPIYAIAHRAELILQVAMALAKCGIYHAIAAPVEVQRYIAQMQMENPDVGRSFVERTSPVIVASVDLLIRREIVSPEQVVLGLVDEGHHVVMGNKWERVLRQFKNAQFAALTATPHRPDRKALHVENGGFFDGLAVGPTAGELVEMGYLVPVEFFGPPPSMIRSELEVSKTSGDFVQSKLRNQAHRKQQEIVGDVVRHYLQIAPGETGLTFAVDVQLATEHVRAFNEAGVPAAMVTDQTPAETRRATFGKLGTGELKQLVNVDIAGEGTDLPAVGVISDAQPTASFTRWMQKIGRVRRILRGKRSGKVIDHVGNFYAMIKKWGHPDDIEWTSLDQGVNFRRKQGPKLEPTRQCTGEGCWKPFEGWSLTCPHCGHTPAVPPARRPEEVEGNLELYDEALLRALRDAGDKAIRIDHRQVFRDGKDKVIADYTNARANAQHVLREALEWWAGIRMHQGMRIDDAYRRFYGTFGVDAATARTLGAPEAVKLTELIRKDLGLI